MTRLIAFLRAINVGGNHQVKMDALRQHFESWGFTEVATYIASGNVIFETTDENIQALERQIEKNLKEALGYEVATFIRTDVELAEIASYQPFPAPESEPGADLYIAFLGDALNDDITGKIMALRTPTDEFHIHGREIYWLRRRNQNTGDFSTVSLEKAIRRPFTVRGAKTVKKMAAKYAPTTP